MTSNQALKRQSVMRTVRSHFVGLVLIMVVPALALAGIFLWWDSERDLEALQRDIMDRARNLSQLVEQEMRISIATLEALRHTATLQKEDLVAFAEIARKVHADHAHWNGVVVTDRTGQQLLNTAARPGQPLPNIAHYEVIQGALSGKASVSEVMKGRVLPVHLVGIDVPVWIDGEVKYALGLSIPLSHFLRLFNSFAVPQEWVIGVVDHKGTIVVRSVDPEGGVGTSAAPMWVKAEGASGIVRGTGKLGVPVIGAFVRSELSAWQTVVSVPENIFYASRNRQVVAVAFVTALLLAGGGAGAFVLAKRVVRPIEHLARNTPQYLRGDAPMSTSMQTLAEARDLAVSLKEAGEQRRQADVQRDAARQQLFQSQKMEAVGQLTGGVAHDFNNLLTVIVGNLDLARRASQQHPLPERIVLAIDRAMNGARRAATLTSQLLAFSRKQALNPRVIDVQDFLNRSAELLRTSLNESISFSISSDVSWPVEIDPHQLETALLNLVLNARDAMPQGGSLRVIAVNKRLEANLDRASVPAGDYVMLSVVDTGGGMPEEVAAHVFEPFYTTKPAGKGTGLGLTQVYGFIKQSAGYIFIDSEVGNGTSVNVYLPRSSKVFTPPMLSTLTKQTGSEQILIVEDDVDVRTFVTETLTELGYRITAAASADDALAALRSPQPFDLLLTDIVLPGISGREMARQAAVLRGQLKILYMTGYDRGILSSAQDLEPGQVLQKPLTAEALARGIRDILDRGPKRDSLVKHAAAAAPAG
jgi:signal transduction histidine kinase/ActR/RegA family two-component response regulator